MDAAGSARAALNTSSAQVPVGCRRCGCARCHARVFPCSVGLCCPCLPSSWKHVKDWLHLVLIFGFLASGLCVALSLVQIVTPLRCESPLCLTQWACAVILLPSMFEFLQIIGTYDESLQAQKQRVEDEVNNLIATINAQLAEMQVVCGKLTESATDFAFRHFNGSREQFERFVQDLGRFHEDIYEDPLMVKELKIFALKWFTVFSQTLLNPDRNPLVDRMQSDFDRCRTVGEVCARITGRLSALKVSTRLQLVPVGSYSLSSSSSRSLQDGDVEDGSFASPADGEEGRCISWIRLECNRCYGREGVRAGESRWPLKIRFFCGHIVILSRRHGNLLALFVLDAFMIFFLAIGFETWKTFLFIANEACLMSILWCMDEIDQITQLQRRAERYQAQNEKIKIQHKQATDSWEKVQQFHDLWNYRTMPFLTIMGKIHRELEIQDREYSRVVETARRDGEVPARGRRLEWLTEANQSLECLDIKLGPISDWVQQGGAQLADEWKQTIGRQLREAERQEDVDKLIQIMPVLTTDLRGMQDGLALGDSSSSSQVQ